MSLFLLRLWARFFATVNIVGAGNSLMAGFHGDKKGRWLEEHIGPVVPATVRFTNLGVGGKSYSQMAADPAAIDASWRAGHVNVLILMDGTNDITNGFTGAEALANLAVLIAGRLALNAWTVIVVTTTARLSDTRAYGPWEPSEVNREILVHNALLVADPACVGAHQVVDVVGAASPFLVPDPALVEDYDIAVFSTVDPDDARGKVRVHWTDAGRAYTGGLLADTVCLAVGLVRRSRSRNEWKREVFSGSPNKKPASS